MTSSKLEPSNIESSKANQHAKDAQPAKTSDSHPLQIASLPLDSIEQGLHGNIGLTFCPGKQHSSYLSGRWLRDLDTDLKVIQDWGATAWLNLMEDQDLIAVNLDPTVFKASVLSANIDYYHLPIVDGSIPNQQTTEDWERLSPILRYHLQQGGNLLIHCRGGLGRTGMIAARLLVELGCPPDIAMTTIRKLRPGSIENDEQEQWLEYDL